MESHEISSSPSDTVLLFGRTFFSMELFTYGIVLAISCMNLVVIGPTKVLNVNLKSILITQSVALILCVFVRSAMIVQKFVSDNPFAPVNVMLQNIMTFDALFRRLLGHVMIIERFLATFFTNSYEKFPILCFNVTWFCITFTIAFVNTVTNGQSWTFTKFNFCTQSASTVISFLEFLLITVIAYYNRKKYAKQIEKASVNNYHIGKRYQVLENMKTAKQLTPAFLCLFLTNIAMTLLYAVIAFHVISEGYQISLALAVGVWTDAFFGAFIEITVITHHPLLKRRFGILLSKVVCCCSTKNQIGDEEVPQPNCVVPMSGNKKSNDGSTNDSKKFDETAEHFKMLQQLWQK